MEKCAISYAEVPISLSVSFRNGEHKDKMRHGLFLIFFRNFFINFCTDFGLYTGEYWPITGKEEHGTVVAASDHVERVQHDSTILSAWHDRNGGCSAWLGDEAHQRLGSHGRRLDDARGQRIARWPNILLSKAHQRIWERMREKWNSAGGPKLRLQNLSLNLKKNLKKLQQLIPGKFQPKISH